jgi:hypothetical protein
MYTTWHMAGSVKLMELGRFVDGFHNGWTDRALVATASSHAFHDRKDWPDKYKGDLIEVTVMTNESPNWRDFLATVWMEWR